MQNLTDKVVWITGASSGIGEALTLELNRKKAKLIISSRRVEELERVKSLCAHPENVHIVPIDLTDSGSIISKAEEAIAVHGHIDLLINNGGISQRSLIIETDMEVDRRVMEVNYFGSVAVTKAVLPSMVKRQIGHVVIITSAVGIITTKFRSGYSASKHALHGFFDTLRIEHHADNIAVTIVCPGFIRTSISLQALTGDGKPQQKMDETTGGGMSAERCAFLIVKAIERKKEEVYVAGFKEKLAIYMKRFFPTLFSKLIRNAKVT
ncbi:MAG: SDR family oxidoreductase [Cyclobacteriaceae bacterium]